jgi:hypothetical protein
MNSKAKFAYVYMILGLILFLFGLISILNYNITQSLSTSSLRSSAFSLTSGNGGNGNTYVAELKRKKSNHTEILILMASISISNNNLQQIGKASDKQGLTNEMDENIYVDFLCRVKNDFLPTNSISSSRVPIKRSISQSDSEDLKPSLSYISRLLLFLLCSSSQVYIGSLISFLLFGVLLVIYGCFNFYQNDIKLNFHTGEYNSRKGSNISNNSEQLNEKAKNMTQKENSYSSNQIHDMSCLDCDWNVFKDKSLGFMQSKSNKNEKNAQLTDWNLSIPNCTNLTTREKSCPFIYDELPDFIMRRVDEKLVGEIVNKIGVSNEMISRNLFEYLSPPPLSLTRSKTAAFSGSTSLTDYPYPPKLPSSPPPSIKRYVKISTTQANKFFNIKKRFDDQLTFESNNYHRFYVNKNFHSKIADNVEINKSKSKKTDQCQYTKI